MNEQNHMFHNFFLMSAMIHEVINEDNQYNHKLEDIFTHENLEFLASRYLSKEIEKCTKNEIDFRWKKVRNDIQCWWEGVDDFLYNKRLNEGEDL